MNSSPQPPHSRRLAWHPAKLAVASLFLLCSLLLAACGEGPSTSGASSPGTATGRGLVILNPTSDRDYFHEFGRLAHGDIVSHVFKLKNTDTRPVTIEDLQASCSCSKPMVSYIDENGARIVGKRLENPVIVLPPGVTAEVSITVDTNHVRVKNVDKLAQVRLMSDSLNTPFITFEMHLLVELAFQATPPMLAMKQVPISGGGHTSCDIVRAVRKDQANILEVLESSPGLEVTIDHFESFGVQVWRVSAVLIPPLKRGSWQGEILLRTSGNDGEGEGAPFRIPVTAQITDDIVIQPTPLGFTPFSTTDGAIASARLLALAPGHRVKILDAHIEGELPEGLVLSYEPKQPDGQGRSEQWNLTLTAPASYPPERVVGRLVFDLDDPNMKRVEAPFIFRGS